MDKQAIEKGIAAYKHEQQVLLRLLRKKNGFTEKDFDRWFKGREYRRRVFLTGHEITGDSFILGMGINGGNMWAEYLELMQMMMAVNLIDATTENGLIHYRIPHGAIH